MGLEGTGGEGSKRREVPRLSEKISSGTMRLPSYNDSGADGRVALSLAGG